MALNPFEGFKNDLQELEIQATYVQIGCQSELKNLQAKHNEMGQRLYTLLNGDAFAFTNDEEAAALYTRLALVENTLKAKVVKPPEQGPLDEIKEKIEMLKGWIPYFQPGHTRDFFVESTRVGNLLKKVSDDIPEVAGCRQLYTEIMQKYEILKGHIEAIAEINKGMAQMRTLEKIEEIRERILTLKKETPSESLKTHCDRSLERLAAHRQVVEFLKKHIEGRTLGPFNQYRKLGNETQRFPCTCCAASFLAILLNRGSWEIAPSFIDTSIRRGKLIFEDICKEKQKAIEEMKRLASDRVTWDMIKNDFQTTFISWLELDKELYYPELKSLGGITKTLDPEYKALGAMLDEMLQKKGDASSIGAIIIHNGLSYAIACHDETYIFYDSHGNYYLNGASGGFIWKFEGKEAFLTFLSFAMRFAKESEMIPNVASNDISISVIKGNCPEASQDVLLPSPYLEERPHIQMKKITEEMSSAGENQKLSLLSAFWRLELGEKYDKDWQQRSYSFLLGLLPEELQKEIAQKKLELSGKNAEEIEILKSLMAGRIVGIIAEKINSQGLVNAYLELLEMDTDALNVSEEEFLSALANRVGNFEMDPFFDDASNDAMIRFYKITPLLDQKLRVILYLYDDVDFNKAQMPVLIKRLPEEVVQVIDTSRFSDSVEELLEKFPAYRMRNICPIIYNVNETYEPAERLAALKKLIEIDQGEGFFKIDSERLKDQIIELLDDLDDYQEAFFKSIGELAEGDGEIFFKADPFNPLVISALDKMIAEFELQGKKRHKIDIEELMGTKQSRIRDQNLGSKERLTAFKEMVEIKFTPSLSEKDIALLEAEVKRSFKDLEDLEIRSEFLTQLIIYSNMDEDGETIFQRQPIHQSVVNALNVCIRDMKGEVA